MSHLSLALTRQASRAAILRRMTLAAAGLSYFLIVVGGIVRITDSGLGCPDWPLCYGNVLPIMTSQAVIEVFHRFFAGGVGLLVLATSGLIFRWKPTPALVQLSALALILLGVQVLLGAWTVWALLDAAVVTAHLATGMAFGGTLVAMAILLRTESQESMEVNHATRGFRRQLTLTAAAIFALIVAGGYVAGSGAALACGVNFPLCNGSVLPSGSTLAFNHWLHRAIAALVVVLAAATAIKVRRVARDYEAARLLRTPAYAMIIGLLAQAGLGAVMVLTGRPAALASLHNAVAAFVWFSAVALAVLGHRLPIALSPPTPQALAPWRQAIADYVALTKPRVISLLLFTTLAAMFLTPAGAPPAELVVWTLVAGYLMAGGANAVNMAYDLDIDRLMKRTSLRPVASGRVSARNAYLFGFALAGLSLAIFVVFVNPLAGMLALAGFVYYTLIYTLWLKRRTWHNIVIGGGAGAMPVLVGWAAASGQLDLAALLLFAVVFYWTPPHFWALALMKRKEYAAAHVPMLPVVANERQTVNQIWFYSIALVVLSVTPALLSSLGGVYLAGALVLGLIFLARAWQLRRQIAPAAALRLYKYSLLYLALLFAFMVVDRAVIA